MFLQKCTNLFRPTLTSNLRTYTSTHRKIAFNFFSGLTMASAASAASNTSFPATPYKPKYDAWPYSPSDFQRYDESDDSVFYRPARLVTHIDDPSIARLTGYYDTVLPLKGAMLDMCTSWKSFYPPGIKTAVQKRDLEVFGVGLNAEEMKLNGVFQDADHWRVLDLNKAPHDVLKGWEGKDMKFDAVTCVVSIDYLNRPVEVCRNLLEAMNEGGRIHLVISNRCFPNKVVKRWMMLSEQARLEMVGDYLHFSGWKDVEIVDLCARDENGVRVTDDHGTVLKRSPRLPDHLDPLWVVRGTKRA